MSLKSAFSTQILHARSERRLTQAQVAEAVCISVRWYQKIEKGITLPNSEILLRLILFLQLDVEVFREEVGLRVPVRSGQRDPTTL